LFGEKYGERVRVVSTGGSEKPFSRELCGGTHARNTADLGLFKIVSEGSVGSNARRIEAVTSMGAVEFVDERLALMDEATATLKCRPADLPERVSQMRDELREAKRNVGVAKGSASGDVVAAALRNASDLGAYRCVFAKLDGVSGKDLRSVWDFIRDGAKGEPIACVVASTTPNGKAALLAAGTESAVAAGFSAGDIVRQVAGLVDGRGGGRPNMAQAGGSDASGIAAALDAAKAALGA
ncbi:MAG: DHHA1 domain-containing protein, partial [Coriobacteriaceae bacterium]|nr:DHHA1 domain-containing protein [Coriobacteriaceae bacterium]